MNLREKNFRALPIKNFKGHKREENDQKSFFSALEVPLIVLSALISSFKVIIFAEIFLQLVKCSIMEIWSVKGD